VLAIIATSEAEKSDALSTPTVAIADGPIFEARFTNVAIGSGAAVDVSLGLANGTHATDADSITEHVLFHVGRQRPEDLRAVEGWHDHRRRDGHDRRLGRRDLSGVLDRRPRPGERQALHQRRARAVGLDVQAQRGTGPMKALLHIEKTTGTTTGSIAAEFVNVRSTDLT
jgi:hypothetical protein